MKIEKVSIFVSGNSYDEMSIDGVGTLDSDENNIVLNFTAPKIHIQLRRDVNEKDVANSYFIKKSPGFKIKWSFNKQDVKPDFKYKVNFFNR